MKQKELKKKRRKTKAELEDEELSRAIKEFKAFIKPFCLDEQMEQEILKYGVRNEYQSFTLAAKYFLINKYIPEILQKLIL